jgi:uracil-DNA glycosylase
MQLVKKINDVVWSRKLNVIISLSVLQKLEDFLSSEYQQFIVYPPQEQIFEALNLTPFNKVKVVILGQDPYHGEGQAHGLAFSVKTTPLPPSLKNIFKELKISPDNGDLTSWAQQGVLLLNTVLTVRRGEANSHQKKGWEFITDKIIQLLSEEKNNLVFVLWGSAAIAKKTLINQNKHCVLEAVHPSPLSAHRGFFGCRHFALVNDYLVKSGFEPINWEIPPKSHQPQLFFT